MWLHYWWQKKFSPQFNNIKQYLEWKYFIYSQKLKPSVW